MNLGQFKSAILARIADDQDEFGIQDGELEESIRSALAMYIPLSRPRETTFTVATTGYEQDLSSLSPYKILDVAADWADGSDFQSSRQPFRYVGEDTVRFDHREFASGEKLRVTYYLRHTIDDLDGATSTTLWTDEEEELITLASAQLLELVLIRMALNQETVSRVESLQRRAEKILSDFYAVRRDSRSNESFVVWGRMG